MNNERNPLGEGDIMNVKKLKLPKVTQEGSGTIKLNGVTGMLDDFLENLNNKFSNTLPPQPISEVELARKIGQQDVIKHLYSLIDKTNRKD